VDTVAGILMIVFSVAAMIAVAIGFIWAARKDGAEDRELQRRLGIRRRTRMGR
jgi:hypothetical protein